MSYERFLAGAWHRVLAVASGGTGAVLAVQRQGLSGRLSYQ